LFPSAARSLEGRDDGSDEGLNYFHQSGTVAIPLIRICWAAPVVVRPGMPNLNQMVRDVPGATSIHVEDPFVAMVEEQRKLRLLRILSSDPKSVVIGAEGLAMTASVNRSVAVLAASAHGVAAVAVVALAAVVARVFLGILSGVAVRHAHLRLLLGFVSVPFAVLVPPASLLLSVLRLSVRRLAAVLFGLLVGL
jgi:hypothetical protein